MTRITNIAHLASCAINGIFDWHLFAFAEACEMLTCNLEPDFQVRALFVFYCIRDVVEISGRFRVKIEETNPETVYGAS